MLTLADQLKAAGVTGDDPTPTPAERPWTARPEAVAALLKNGGVIFVTGIVMGYIPRELRDCPRFQFREVPQDSSRGEHAYFPSNTRFVCVGRFIRHSYADKIRGECRNKNIPFEYFTSGLGPIWKLLSDVRRLLDTPVTPIEESPVQSMTKPAGTWGVEAAPKDSVVHLPAPSTTPVPRKRSAVRDFIAARSLTLDFKQTITREAERLLAAYQLQGGVSTQGAFEQALRTWAMEHKKTFVNGRVGPRTTRLGIGAMAPGTVVHQTLPMVSNTDVDLYAGAPTPPPAPTPKPAPAHVHSDDDDFAVMRKMIADAKATLALLEEFVEGIQVKERSRRERDARLKELLNS